MKKQKNQKKNEAREDMETGDTARSGTLSGAPPDYETTATDFFEPTGTTRASIFFSVSFVPPAPHQGYERTSYLKPAIHHLSREAITLVALWLARCRNLFPVEQLRPVEHLGPAKAAHRREEPCEK